jgi:hypothetical protein
VKEGYHFNVLLSIGFDTLFLIFTTIIPAGNHIQAVGGSKKSEGSGA